MMMNEMKGLDASDVPGNDVSKIPLGSGDMECPCNRPLERRLCPSYLIVNYCATALPF
jgi:hypothetical protein